MPNYDYECDSCKNIFEKFQSMTEKPLKTCPKCKGPVRRLIGAGAGIIFKGSGFYQTDYRSSKYEKRAKEDSSSGTCARVPARQGEGQGGCNSTTPCGN